MSVRPFAALFLLTLCSRLAVAQAPVAPPVAPIRPVTDTYFGTTITDPYRWMENLDSPEAKTWFQGQSRYTRSVLDQIPNRAALLARIQALDNAGVSLRDVQVAGRFYFYRKAVSGDSNYQLFVRDGLHGPERILLNPQTLTRGSVHYSIDYYTPSPDGTSVAVGVSPGGSEASTMRILRTADGSEVGERIDRTDYPEVSWNEDGHSFFYSRLQKMSSTDPETAKYQKGVAFRHVLGTDPAQDTPVFGYALSPQTPFALDDVPIVAVIPGCPYVFGIVGRGVQNENAVYYTRQDALRGAATPWRRLADFADDVVAVDGEGAMVGLAARGQDVYLLTHKNAPRYKIVKMNLTHPDLAQAEAVVPPGRAVIRSFGQAQDGLYIEDLDGGVGRVHRLPFGGPLQSVPLPFDGSVGLILDPHRIGALLNLTSWTQAGAVYSYVPGESQITNTGLKPPSPIDMSGYTAVEVQAKSADGTLVPLSIITKKGLTLDGSHPALLNGYGAYGITLEPEYRPTSLAWLERGGVLAEAHVRGGGEGGEEWHLAGQKLTKHHTWEDFLACGQYLIDHGYTSPAHLAGEGTSAGGITIGRAITARPDLFGAALIRVGSSNPLRAETTANGPSNIPEFGTVTTQEGFQGLSAMDAYLHVQDGVKYPAVMVETGINDPRVASWEPAKMAARLQAATGSGKPVLLRVDYDAGHGIGSTKAQSEMLEADEFAFLFQQLGDPAFQPNAPGLSPNAPGLIPTAPEKQPTAPGTVKAIDPITVTGE